jgi:hypothetical protein
MSFTTSPIIINAPITLGFKGDKGDSFTPDAVGLIADLGDFDAEDAGFVYLSTDEYPPKLYFRQGDTPGVWSDGVPFITTGEGLAMALLVEDESERLGLSVEQATDVVVVQDDDNSAWTLVADGDPTDTADWIQIASPSSGDIDGGDPSSTYDVAAIDGGTP